MKDTTDLWFATFLQLEGEKVADFVKVGPRKGRFRFNITDEKWKEYKLKYYNGVIPKIRQAQEMLKELLY